jgi:hypothetical protein
MRSFHKIMMLAAGVMLAGTMAAGNAQALTKPGTPSVGSSVELAKYKAKHKAKHKAKEEKSRAGPLRHL